MSMRRVRRLSEMTVALLHSCCDAQTADNVENAAHNFVPDKLHPDGVHLVEEPKLAALVPPHGRETREVRDLIWVHARVRGIGNLRSGRRRRESSP